MSAAITFGSWLRRRRKALDLTQSTLAHRMHCAVVTIRKIEADERRPSVVLAEQLAIQLQIPAAQREDFLRFARTVAAPEVPDELLPAWPGAQPAVAARLPVLPGYELAEQLGAGGFGVVYHAHQQSVGREVAIKIIRPEYAVQPEFLRRFKQEAGLVARLEHPAIVPLYDYQASRQSSYLVMRYMRGGSLQTLLARGPLGLAAAMQLVEQLAQGLDYAHRQGVVHRDLKPANILLDDDGNVYLADFGIAKDVLAPRPEDRTLPGVIVGTPAYLAPEQIEGGAVGPAADLYSLGLLLFEMLAGMHPFAGASVAELLDHQLHQPLPALRDYQPALPPGIEPVIQHATAKRPRQRYPNALGLLADLRALAQPALQARVLGGAAAPAPSQATSTLRIAGASAADYFKFLDKGHADHYRSEQIEQLAQAIRARENRLLEGLPGMGVSNLLRFLVARGAAIIPRAIFAYYDCDTHAGESAEEALFETLATQLGEQGLAEVGGSAAHGYARLQRLVERVEGDAAARIVLAIDQADGLVAQVGRSFYQRLKALTDLNKRVCLLLAVSPLAAAQADPDDLLFAGRRLAVGRFCARDRQDAIGEEQRRLGLSFDAPTQALLAELTGGHPGLLRALSSAVAAGALAGVPAAEAAERLLARDDVRYRCRKLWNALPVDRQRALRSLAMGQPIDREALGWLAAHGLSESAAAGADFCSTLLRRFIEHQPAPPSEAAGPPGQLAPVCIMQPSLDAAGVIRAGKVLKGRVEVAVSPLVLRLIYFLLRERRICTRHEIAGYVWAGVNADGVSEAAIDDLIRQARQRLGSGYIKNHRGQGYEWVVPPA